jgi:hypothetical protein
MSAGKKTQLAAVSQKGLEPMLPELEHCRE